MTDVCIQGCTEDRDYIDVLTGIFNSELTASVFTNGLTKYNLWAYTVFIKIYFLNSNQLCTSEEFSG